MKGKFALMAGTAAIALIAAAPAAFATTGDASTTVATAAPTDAAAPTTVPATSAAKKHRHALAQKAAAVQVVANDDGPSSTRAAMENEKYDQLEQRVESLEAEVQSEEQRETADHAADQSLADKLNVDGWWAHTKIGSTIFYDLTDIDNTNDHHKASINGFSFDIKRFYITVDHQFDDQWSAHLVTDANYQSTLGQTSLFIKKAYVEWKYAPELTVRVGSADTTWIPYDEGIYGYRFVENTLIDRIKFGNSADWGVHVLGSFEDGLIGYQFSAVSGSGYKKPLRSLQPDFEGRVNLNWQGFQAAVGGYIGTEGASDAFPSANIHHHYERFDALAAYTDNGIRVGIEYFQAMHHAQETAVFNGTTIYPENAYGFSPFASWQFCPEWSVFGRYDYVRPEPAGAGSLTLSKHFHNDYFNVGVDYKPIPMLDFALVYKNDHGSQGDFADQNGTIGGDAFAPGEGGTYQEVGLFGQIKF